jgi:SAM-dependent methyltransferase
MLGAGRVTLKLHRFEVGVAVVAAIAAALLGLIIAVRIDALGVSQDCLDRVRASQTASAPGRSASRSSAPVPASRDDHDRRRLGAMSDNRSREAYYDWRAPEYDDFWLQRRRYAGSPRSWGDEREEVLEFIASLPPRRTLDVACGTGFITEHLAGEVTGLDQSSRMLGIARRRLPDAALVQGSAFSLPFPDDAFERVFTSHFYGHLQQAERGQFLAEAGRVAPELVVFDAGLHGGTARGVWQERELNDGTQWLVYKRFFSPEQLVVEIGGEVLYAGEWFVCVRSLVARDDVHNPSKNS